MLDFFLSRLLLRTERHPDEALLLYLEGELGGRQLEQVEKHVRGCWKCRASLLDLQTTIAEFVNYRERALAAAAGSTRPATGLFRQRVSRIFEQHERRPVWPGRSTALKAATAVMFLIATGMAWLLLYLPRPVSAAELVASAVSAEAVLVSAHESRVLRQQMTVEIELEEAGQPRQETVVVDSVPSQMSTRIAEGGGSLRAELLSVLAANGLDDPWPHYAAAFAKWRQNSHVVLESTRRVVLPDGTSAWEVHVRVAPRAAINQITNATLVLAESDLRPLSLKLKALARSGWREYRIHSVSWTLKRARPALSGLPSDASRPHPPTRMVPESRVPTLLVVPGPGPAKLDWAAVEAHLLLHRDRACTREAIQVERLPDAVSISGVVETDRDALRLTHSLSSLPQTRVMLESVESAVRLSPAARTMETGDAGAVVRGTAVPAASYLRGFLEGLAGAGGAKDEIARIADRALQLAEDIRSEHSALRALQRSFPPDCMERLSPAQRASVHAMLLDHVRSALRFTSAYRELLAGLRSPDADGSIKSASAQQRGPLDPTDLAKVIDATASLFGGANEPPDIVEQWQVLDLNLYYVANSLHELQSQVEKQASQLNHKGGGLGAEFHQLPGRNEVYED